MAECHHWPIRIKYYTHVSQCSECVCVFKAKIQSVTLTFCSLKEEFVCVSVCLERSWFSWSDVPWDTVTDVTSVHSPSLSLSHTHTHTHSNPKLSVFMCASFSYMSICLPCACVFLHAPACVCAHVCVAFVQYVRLCETVQINAAGVFVGVSGDAKEHSLRWSLITGAGLGLRPSHSS